MLKRKAQDLFEDWHSNHNTRALLVTGARQVGKTFLVKHYLKQTYKHVVTFDLVEQPDVLAAFNSAHNTNELFMAISAHAGLDLVEGQTAIFIDEVQMCTEAITAIKYLLQQKNYDFVFSGSLLGVELNNIRSLPVGSLRIVDMYPLDFEEFCWANGVGENVLAEVQACFAEKRPVLSAVHNRLLALFHSYLMVGGMPAAVEKFIATSNLAEVKSIQDDIVRLYRWDISQYAPQKQRLSVRQIFDQIPSQLDSQSKRFNFSSLAKRGTYERYKDDLVWLVDAGVALPVVSVSEPRHPLRLSEGSSYFKLFMDDVGLLCAACGMDVVKSIVSDNLGVNYGSIFENAVAQELHAHGHNLHYFRSKKAGELDFVIEAGSGMVLPIEVKSGKDYKRHSALTNVMMSQNYQIDSALVLCENNLMHQENVTYCPVYMAMYI